STLSKKSNGQNGNEAKTPATTSATASSTSKSDKKDSTLRDIFIDCLKDVYSAENQLLKAMPEVAKACYNEELEDAFNRHFEQTKRQVERLDKIFSRMNIEKGEKKCEAMAGLIEEIRSTIKDYNESPARDSALIIGAQKIEHYEIASYGSLCELADVLGYHQAGSLLDRTLQEEGDTDHLLTELAMDINDAAAEQEFEVNHNK
ncbi:MAG: ferritin-like domain-containing protein, partial [Bacteroidota bacterium]